MRRGRRGLVWLGRSRRRGWGVWSSRQANWSARRGIGSRLIAVTRSVWLGCFGLGSLSGSGWPIVGEEAARDLVRARDDARGDLMRARHRLSKLLLRQGLVYPANAWTQAHEVWLRSHTFAERSLAIAFDEAYATVLGVDARRDRLDGEITEMAALAEWAPVVGRLACLRGVGTLTAFGLAVAIGDWHCFSGNTIGSYLGMVPSEASTGGKRRLGSITKTGNSHARRLLVEAAWHHRKPYRPSRELCADENPSPPRYANAPRPPTAGFTAAGKRSMPATSAPPSR